jgi:two-component system chemotaxis response regulator CheY
MANLRVLSVGQCAMDHGLLSRYLGREFGAEVRGARTFDEALMALRAEPAYDLVLVNRVSDADGTPGVDLIRSLRSDAGLARLPVMLVSNYSDAQEQAVALGALPGFGKAELGTPKAYDALWTALQARV